MSAGIDAGERLERYDGATADELARLLDVPGVVALRSVSSTLDVAHSLGAAGAAAGMVILAEEQTAGRGRGGSVWRSAPGRGIWLTLLERPRDPSALDVLALRAGLRAAAVLDRFTGEPVRLKWPNDLWLREGKLAGILTEARWRGDRPDWVAIGIGINGVPAPEIPAAALRPGTSPIEVLAELVPAVRAAAAARGPLAPAELEAWAARDLAAGRRCVAPAAGMVGGITAGGALIVVNDAGRREYRAGSLILEG